MSSEFFPSYYSAKAVRGFPIRVTPAIIRLNSYDLTARVAQFHHIPSLKINQKPGELATQLLGSNSQPKKNYALQNPKQEVKNTLKATAANPEFAFSRQKAHITNSKKYK